MPVKIERDRITFSSGRTAYAYGGIVGLDPNLNLTYGYDGDIPWPLEADCPVTEESLTAADMAELADHMIAEWTRFKAGLDQPKPEDAKLADHHHDAD